MKLYEIVRDLLFIRAEIDEEKDIDLEQLENLEIAYEQKLEGCCAIVKEMNAEQEAIKNAINSLEKRSKSLENNKNRLKEYIYNMLEQMNKTKFKTALHSVSITKSPISVKINDEDLIPEEFFIIKINKQINKKAIIEKYKEKGNVPEGANIITNTHLRIK